MSSRAASSLGLNPRAPAGSSGSMRHVALIPNTDRGRPGPDEWPNWSASEISHSEWSRDRRAWAYVDGSRWLPQIRHWILPVVWRLDPSAHARMGFGFEKV